MAKKYNKKKKKQTPLSIFETMNVPGFGEVFVKTRTTVEDERKAERRYRAEMKRLNRKIPKTSRYYRKGD